MRIIGGEGGGGKGGSSAPAPRTPVEGPNTLRSTSTARVIDLVAEGPIVGLVDGLKSVYFDGTPLVDASGKVNFANVTVESRLGLPDQAPLAGFSDVEAVTGVNTKVLNATPVVRTINDTNTDRLRLTVQIPALLTRNATTGDQTAGAIELKIEVKPSGGAYAVAVSETIQGKTVSPYEKDYNLALTTFGAGPWDVKVTRVSADFDNVTLVGDLKWSAYTTIVDHRLMYPDSALFGVTCDAQTFGGNIPTRSYLLDGIEMQVPTNYDPVTRNYTGAWDGTFKTAFANNPAWVFWLLGRNERFGLGEFMAATQLDKWSLYAIGQYCDELVDDGQGATEPRYTFNGVIADRDDAYRVLMSLASVFRGMVYWSSGTVFATADMPSDPVKLVTPANVIDGLFSYEGASLKSRHSVVLVTWNDPADSYRPNIEVVEDVDAIEAFGYRPLEIAAVGCTSRGQARRYGKWVLETETYESEVATYRCSWDHADLFPGQLIEIADPAYAGLRSGGRLADATIDTLTLDDTVDIAALNDYSVDVVLPTGAVETRAVSNAVGSTSVLQLATPLTSIPVAGAIWILTSSIAAPRPFRVVAITETDKHIFEISALLHSPGKYARVEQGLVVEDPAYTTLPSGPLGNPINLTPDDYLYEAGGAIYGAITASWTGAKDARIVRYEVQVARLGLDYARAGFTETTSFDIQGISGSETSIGIRVRAVDDLGRSSDWLTAPNVPVTMFSSAPDDVSNLRVSTLGDTMIVVWDPVVSLGVSHYIARFSQETVGATWGAAQVVQDYIVGTSVALPAATGTLLVKAVSLAGVESVNEVGIVITAGGLTDINAVETVNPAPSWSGTLVDVEVDAGNLQLVDGETEGLYTFDGYTDLGEVFTSRVSAFPAAYGENPDLTIGGWVHLSDVLSLSGTDPSQWSIRIEERHTSDDPSGSPTWSEWSPLATNDITARAFEFRVFLFSLAEGIRPVITDLPITIDMPDRHIAANNVTSGTDAGGFSVAFDPPFHSLKAVTLAHVLQTGDYFEWVAKDETGFTIRFKDAGGTVVSRVFDFDSIGFGRQVS